MFLKYVLPLIALALLSFAGLHVVRAHATPQKAAPPVLPGRAGYCQCGAGVGLVEAQTENIAAGTHLAGVVTEVFVGVGQKVRRGDRLFRLDDRALLAEKRVRQAALAAAQAQLARLEQMPRTQEVPAARARVRELDAALADQQGQLARARRLYAQRAISEEEYQHKLQSAQVAREQLLRAQADLGLLLDGAWKPDLKVAEASVGQAKAALEQTETELGRLTVHALVDGEVLQVNVRPGEYAAAGAGQALVVLGNVSRLHVRAEIDEHDIPRFRPGAAARAALRGRPEVTFPLTFVRVEPYVTPKKVLTNESGERLDTRVLQVLFAVEAADARLYVGQQLDVTISADDKATR